MSKGLGRPLLSIFISMYHPYFCVSTECIIHVKVISFTFLPSLLLTFHLRTALERGRKDIMREFKLMLIHLKYFRRQFRDGLLD